MLDTAFSCTTIGDSVFADTHAAMLPGPSSSTGQSIAPRRLLDLLEAKCLNYIEVIEFDEEGRRRRRLSKGMSGALLGLNF
jgi:hypothetical protein